jgi:hypothetical protein
MAEVRRFADGYVSIEAADPNPEQASQVVDGRMVFRWWVFTDQGRKVLWQDTAENARARAESHGLKVERVEPARSGGPDQ